MAGNRMFQAIDTFVAELADGSALHVAKGAVFHEAHELVKRDKGNGLLFRAMEEGQPADPPEAPAKAPAEVKAEVPAEAPAESVPAPEPASAEGS
jgi:hypothetical protein